LDSPLVVISIDIYSRFRVLSKSFLTQRREAAKKIKAFYNNFFHKKLCAFAPLRLCVKSSFKNEKVL